MMGRTVRPEMKPGSSNSRLDSIPTFELFGMLPAPDVVSYCFVSPGKITTPGTPNVPESACPVSGP